MKKTSKPASKKAAVKKPAAKKSSSKPKSRKAAGQGELAQVVERLALIAERLDQAVERLEQSALRAPATQSLPPRDPALETLHQPADEHADDFEAPGPTREEVG
jgi:hypothetical protein